MSDIFQRRDLPRIRKGQFNPAEDEFIEVNGSRMRKRTLRGKNELRTLTEGMDGEVRQVITQPEER